MLKPLRHQNNAQQGLRRKSKTCPYDFELGGKAYLCVRKIKNTGLFKPYAIIDQKTFDAEIQNLQK